MTDTTTTAKPLDHWRDSAPRHKDVWNYLHAGMAVEITHHAVGELVNDGKGIWCYYIYILESRCKPEAWEALWLEDKVVKYYPCSPERVTHDYLHLLPDCEWHGGITYYGKHGHSVGHRAVQLGCDFSHLWDHERGCDFELEEIVFEANRTAELVAKEVLPL